MAALRHCRWCKLILDDHAPMGEEMVSRAGQSVRRTRAHCPSANCDWCQPCMRRRHFEIEAAEAERAGQVPPPDQMT
jgi:hypothetical protein